MASVSKSISGASRSSSSSSLSSSLLSLTSRFSSIRCKSAVSSPYLQSAPATTSSTTVSVRARHKSIGRRTIRAYSFTSRTLEEEQDEEMVSFTYFDTNTDLSHMVTAKVGTHLLDVAHDNDIPLEGACGGELACATCHLVFEPEIYEGLPPKVEEEDDMLDLALELTETSRLGCQIRVDPKFEGMTVKIPDDGL